MPNKYIRPRDARKYAAFQQENLEKVPNKYIRPRDARKYAAFQQENLEKVVVHQSCFLLLAMGHYYLHTLSTNKDMFTMHAHQSCFLLLAMGHYYLHTLSTNKDMFTMHALIMGQRELHI
ncbi:hypothetical protein QE152_g31346 [Popillia japonica]|uniref:Uncharacterized protein n=1 Tax=Popillia japonica TaxID=7064 RepID=A0AAW1J1A4_POPJA